MIRVFHRRHQSRAIVGAGVAVFTAVCLYSRHWKECKLNDVPLAKDSGAFYLSRPENTLNESEIRYGKRDISSIINMITRSGMTGKSIPGSKSVKEELKIIKEWHQKHGYSGGIVLRELYSPLYSEDGIDDSPLPNPSSNLSSRENYFVYYEIQANGHQLHQIFCRGTTLLGDVLTCLNSRLVYDEELGIRVHAGFLGHANRLVNDVLPLLGFGKMESVEVVGHSLGGSVAWLVAMKLKKRGYNVKRVISVAGARFIDARDVDKAVAFIPKDNLRVEDDLDIVTYLPPWASSVGDKLWLTNEHVRFIPMHAQRGNLSWTESPWINLRLFETVWNEKTTHTVRSYLNKLSSLTDALNSRNSEDDI